MKKYRLVTRGDKKTQELVKELKNLLDEFSLEEGKEKEKVDYVFSIGGDGTFLRAVQGNFKYNPLYFSINTGNFGYLCEFSKDDYYSHIKDYLKNSDEKNTKIIHLLELDIVKDNRVKKLYALNEFRINTSSERTIEFDVIINDEFLERLRSDGCLISSSIGSSGSSKSLGGSLIDNNLELLQFLEDAPISNAGYFSINSPIVLEKNSVFQLKHFNTDHFNIHYDSNSYKVKSFDLKNDYLKIYLSKKKVRIFKNKDSNYIKKTSHSFVKS